MKKYKIKYKRLLPKFPNGGNMMPYGQMGQLAQMYGQQASTNSDGTVNKDGYAWSSAIGGAGQGAAIGSAFGPIGMGVGAGVGLIGGYVTADNKADQINNQVRQNKISQEKYNHDIESQRNNFASNQQSMYNNAYNAINSSVGNSGASLYGEGGKIPYKAVAESTNVNHPNYATNTFMKVKSTGYKKDLKHIPLAKIDFKKGKDDLNRAEDYTQQQLNGIDAIKMAQKTISIFDPTPLSDVVSLGTNGIKGKVDPTDIAGSISDLVPYGKPVRTFLKVAGKAGDLAPEEFGAGGTLGDGDKSSKKVIDRNAYQSFLNGPLENEHTRAYGSNNVIFSGAEGKGIDAPFANNIDQFKGYKVDNSIDKYPVYISPTGSTMIRHKNGYVDIGNYNKLKYSNAPVTTTSSVTPMNKIVTPTTVVPPVQIDPNRKPLNFGSPNGVVDPNTGQVFGHGNGEVIQPIVQSAENNWGNPSKAYGGYTKYAYGGTSQVPGGELNQLSSDTVKAEGNTHQEGGIQLESNGQPYAEVEDQEILKGNKVYSDRIKLSNGKTIAEMAEKLGKQKGKAEERAESNSTRTKNAGKRELTFADKKLNQLFDLQESITGRDQNPQNSFKNAYGGITKYGYGGDDNYEPDTVLQGQITKKLEENNTGQNTVSTPNNTGGNKFNWNNALNAGASLVPYVDNIYNANLINKTPQLPTPGVRQAYNQTAMPMKTTYNIDPALNNAQSQYRSFTKGIDENTSSSQVARANKLGAFAETLNNRSNLYGTKENMENQMENANAQNIQNVNNQNAQNNQNVYNQNLGLKDNYNMLSFQRLNDINQQKSANISNAVNDAQTQIQDRNMQNTQQGQIGYNSMMYNDGAGIAKQIGTPTFDNMIKSNPQYKASLYNKLVQSGQQDAIRRFEQMYGKP